MELGLGEAAVIGVAVAVAVVRLLPLPMAFAVLGVLLGVAFVRARNKFSVWRRLGVPGPDPVLFFGHTIAIRNGFLEVDKKWIEQYGKICGTYIFSQADLLVADPQLLRRIMVKDFNNFVDRRGSPLVREDSRTIFAKILSLLRGQRWKDVRNTITPTFTAGKMKQMIYLINESLDAVCEILGEKVDDGQSVAVKQLCGAFTLDVIAKVAFATRIDAMRNPDNPFMRHAKAIGDVTLRSFSIVFFLLFPNVAHFLNKQFGVLLFCGESERFFVDSCRQIIKQRRDNPRVQTKPDFLQLCLNAAAEDGGDGGGDDAPAEEDAELARVGGGGARLTEDDVIAQSFLFIIAGFDTTASTIQFALYLLAQHTDVQERCYEEAARVIGDQAAMTYEQVQRLPYIESVMFETLRLFPPAVRLDRECVDDWVDSESGLLIPKGAIVSVPVYYIHHSDEFYAEPEKFMPERFSAEERAARDPFTFLAFGAGPRNCVGLRFAQMEVKMSLARLVLRFKFVAGAKTEKMPLELTSASLLRAKNPIYLDVERR